MEHSNTTTEDEEMIHGEDDVDDGDGCDSSSESEDHDEINDTSSGNESDEIDLKDYDPDSMVFVGYDDGIIKVNITKEKLQKYVDNTEGEKSIRFGHPDYPAQEIPPALVDLVDLDYLHLYTQTPIPYEIWNLTQLKKLHIVQFDKIQIPDEIEKLDQLQEIHVVNWDPVKFPKTLNNLGSLKRLIVGSEDCHGFDAEDVIIPLDKTCQLNKSLSELSVYEHKLDDPGCIGYLINLQTLRLDFCDLRELPDCYGNLKHLKELYLCGNTLSPVPEVIGKLTKLVTLDLSCNAIEDLPASCSNLKQLEYLDLENNKLDRIPLCVYDMVSLKVLDVGDNKIQFISPQISKLRNLEKIKLSENPVTILPTEMADLTELKEIEADIQKMIQPPREICGQGTPSMKVYLKDLRKSKSIHTSKQQVLFVGNPCAGKTSLAWTLVRGIPALAKDEERTKVMEPIIWEPDGEPGVQLRIADFGGHESYKATSQFFYCPRSQLVLVFDISRYQDDRFNEDIGDWFSSFQAYLPRAKIAVVASHADLVLPGEVHHCIESIWDNLKRLESQRVTEIEHMIAKLSVDISDLEASTSASTEPLSSVARNVRNKVKFMSHVHRSHQDGNEKELSHHMSLLQIYRNKEKELKKALDDGLLLHTEMFVISSKSMHGIDDLASYLIKNCKEEKIILPEPWYEFTNAITRHYLKDNYKLFLNWDLVRNIHVVKIPEDDDFASLHLQLSYLQTVGDILMYQDNPDLQNFIFHNVGIIIEVMKQLFQHDIWEVLDHSDPRFAHFAYASFEKMKDSFKCAGIVDFQLLLSLWSALNFSVQEVEALVDLFKTFHLCFEVENEASDNRQLLFPWFLPEAQPSDIKNVWPDSSQAHELQFEFHFPFKVPQNFLQHAQVLLHQQIDPLLSCCLDWKYGSYGKKSQTKVLLTSLRQSHPDVLSQSQSLMRLSVRGSDLQKLWNGLKDISCKFVEILKIGWPGTLYSTFLVCPHCIRLERKHCHLYPGSIIEQQYPKGETHVPCGKVTDDVSIPICLVYPVTQETPPGLVDEAKQYLQNLKPETCDGKTGKGKRSASCVKLRETNISVECDQVQEIKRPCTYTEAKSNAADFMKSQDDSNYASFYQCLTDSIQSIGVIESPVLKGTGFRVGSCYLITNYHVVEGIMGLLPGQPPTLADVAKLSQPNVTVEFNYNKPRATNTQQLTFDLMNPLPWWDASMDVAVLKLHGLFGPIPKISMFEDVHRLCKDIWIVGHPGGNAMKFEKCEIVTPAQVQTVLNWAGGAGVNNFYAGADDKRFVSFNAAFEHGASGSPCFVAGHDHIAAVAAVYTRGYPTAANRLTVVTRDKTFEQAVKITSICEKMKSTDPRLCTDIFGTHVVRLSMAAP